jgi:hypothetical protein
MYIQLDEINTQDILDYYLSIEKNITWFDSGPKGRQSGIQYFDNEDQFLSATGRARIHDKKFNKLNTFYSNSVIEKIISKYNLYRTRWIWVNPFSCYSIHNDFSPRIHIPIITNPQCLFLFPPNQTFHLETNKVYRVDTTKKHTFINCSDHPRLHLVGAILP